QLEKYQQGDFGYCPRVYCENQHMLPIGELFFCYSVKCHIIPCCPVKFGHVCHIVADAVPRTGARSHFCTK
ncbi:unnamed protein product, partial [Tetraodon nigroviridis]